MLNIVPCHAYASCNNVSDVHAAGGCNIDGEDDSYDFGTGAGFYVDATEEKWKSHYKMYSYITKEVIRSVSESMCVCLLYRVCHHSWQN